MKAKRDSSPLLKAFKSLGVKSPKATSKKRKSSSGADFNDLIKKFDKAVEIENEEEEYMKLLARIRSKKSPKTTPVKKTSDKKKPVVKKFDLDEMIAMVSKKRN